MPGAPAPRAFGAPRARGALGRDSRVAPAVALFVLPGAGAAAAEPGSAPRISVLTLGPGDHPFARFGHNAVLVEDEFTKESRVYNYGTYDFSSPTLIPDFLSGRPLYWVSVSTLGNTLASYRAQNRSITKQELSLTPAERRQLARKLAHDALPKNRHYRYDYYLDNCSTRVRDLVDDALAGALREASLGPARLTYRGHTSRLVEDSPLVAFGLDLALASRVDEPIRRWDEMFLPESLAAGLRNARRSTATSATPAVASEAELFVARRAPLPAEPPDRIGSHVLLGGLAGTGLLFLGRAAPRNLVARLAFWVVLSVLGLATGLLGALLGYLWLGTNHLVAHSNENLLQMSPLGLAFAPLALAVATGRRGARSALRLSVVAAAGLSLMGLVLKLFPGFAQVNGSIVALTLPLWVGTAIGAHLAFRNDGPLG